MLFILRLWLISVWLISELRRGGRTPWGDDRLDVVKSNSESPSVTTRDGNCCCSIIRSYNDDASITTSTKCNGVAQKGRDVYVYLRNGAALCIPVASTAKREPDKSSLIC